MKLLEADPETLTTRHNSRSVKKWAALSLGDWESSFMLPSILHKSIVSRADIVRQNLLKFQSNHLEQGHYICAVLLEAKKQRDSPR